MHWKPSQDQILKKRWGRESASAIGQRIGKTKNAIIGRAWRLGLPNMAGEFGGGGYRTPEGEARRIAAVKAHFRNPKFKEMHRQACVAAWKRRLENTARMT